jgi:Putative serine esterase (DUF676)
MLYIQDTNLESHHHPVDTIRMAQNVHLLVCIHGLWGSPDTLSELTRFIKAKYPTSSTGEPLASDMHVDILVTKSNGENRTYDGIDWCAERIADEVCCCIMRNHASNALF